MFLNLFLFYQVVRPLGRKSVNKYLYLYLYLRWVFAEYSWSSAIYCNVYKSTSCHHPVIMQHSQLTPVFQKTTENFSFPELISLALVLF